MPPRCWGSCCERDGSDRRDRVGLLRGLVRRGSRPGRPRPAPQAGQAPAGQVGGERPSRHDEADDARLRPRGRRRRGQDRRPDRGRASWTSTTTSPQPWSAPRSTASTCTCCGHPTGGRSSTPSGSSPIRPRERTAMSVLDPDTEGYVESEGVRIHCEVTGSGWPDDPAAADLDRRPQTVLEGAGALLVAAFPGRLLRRARQRPLRPAAGRRGIRLRRPGPACPGGARRHRDRTGCRVGLSQGERLGAAARRGAPRPRARSGLDLPVARDHRRPSACDVAQGRSGRPAGARGCLSSSETRWSTGSSTTRRTGRAHTRTSCGSSSACASPNRTRPSRSRTASAGDSTPRRTC